MIDRQDVDNSVVSFLLVLISETSPTNMPCTVPEVEAAIESTNSDTSIVKSQVEH